MHGHVLAKPQRRMLRSILRLLSACKWREAAIIDSDGHALSL
jgi:hypothetical protein